MLYSIAFIMDPRAKIRGFNKALSLLSNLSGTNYSPYLTEVRAQLSTMFNKYDEKFGAVRTKGHHSQPVLVRKKVSGVRFMVLILILVQQPLDFVLVMLPTPPPLYLEELLQVHCFKQQALVLVLV